MVKIKKQPFLAFVLFSLLSVNAWSIDQAIGPFSGLNNADNPATIPADKAQDLLNVDLSLGGRSVKKREGYGLAYALSITTSPVHGVYEFFDASGNDVALSFNDSRMTSSINGGAISVLFSSGPSGATYQCTDSQGFAYCVNTTRNNLVKTNGATYSTVAPASVGTMVTVTPDRLVLSGFSATPNRIDFSAAADFTSWTTGVSPTSAFNFTITAPGSRITHICYAFNRVMWFKDSSFGYILQGQTASDWLVQIVSPNVGTLDNSSVYYQGIIYFRGSDAHIWSYDGSNLVKLTRDIGGTISASQSRGTNSWTQSSVSDWGDGSIDNTFYADTDTVSGRIQATFPEIFSSVRDGNNSSKNVWVAETATSAAATLSTTSLSGLISSDRLAYETASLAVKSIHTSSKLNSSGSGTTYYFEIISRAGTTTNTNFVLTTSTKSSLSNLITSGTYWRLLMQNGAAVSSVVNLTNSCGLSAGGSSTFPYPVQVQFFIDTNRYSVTLNGSSALSGSHTCSTAPAFGYLAVENSIGSVSTTTFDNVSVYPGTFTFSSQIKNANSLTSWDSFSATFQNNSGTNSFSIRAATNTFSINSSTPAWTSVTSGNTPSISTGTFFQIRDAVSNTSTATLSPAVLDEFTQNWFEGQASDKAYGIYFKDAVWWSVASGAGASTNNKILRFDLLNTTWLLYDIPINGFYARQNNLYFGSASTGNIFKFGDTDSDNGSAINAYWKSKDFFGSSPFTDSDITTLSIFFGSVSNSTMTATYTVNGSSETSYSVPLYRANASFGINNRNLLLGTVGNTFNVKFGNNATDQPFEVFAIQYGETPKPWKPGNQ